MNSAVDIHELNLPDTVPDPRDLAHLVTKVYNTAAAAVHMYRGASAPTVVEFRYVVEDDSHDIIVRVRDTRDKIVTQFQVVYYSASGWGLRNYVKELGPVSRMCHYLEVPIIKEEELRQLSSLVNDILSAEAIFHREGWKDFKY